jgi:hypothetical protein
MSTLHMPLDRGRKRKLRRVADARRLSMSAVIRDLIDSLPEPRNEARPPKVRT